MLVIAIIFLMLFSGGIYSVNRGRPKFFKGNLRRLEKELFEKLAEKLGEPAGSLLARQLPFLKRGVRLYFPKAFVLELYHDDKNPLPDEILFKRDDEYTLATLSWKTDGIRYQTEFTTYSGRIWGFKTKPNPARVMHKPITRFESFKLNNDPMVIELPDQFENSES